MEEGAVSSFCCGRMVRDRRAACTAPLRRVAGAKGLKCRFVPIEESEFRRETVPAPSCQPRFSNKIRKQMWKKQGVFPIFCAGRRGCGGEEQLRSAGNAMPCRGLRIRPECGVLKMRSYRICVFILLNNNVLCLYACLCSFRLRTAPLQAAAPWPCCRLLPSGANVPELKTFFLRIFCARAFQPFSGPFAGHFVS